MNKLYIIANWKANKTLSEAKSWLQKFPMSNFQYQMSNKEIVICPPFTLLAQLKSEIEKNSLFIQLGAQDISPFPLGSYTGEIAGKQLKEFVDYVIIGHSERRKYFHENDQTLSNKVDMALENQITPIFCVQDEHTIIPKDVTLVAYEPVFAIGTGDPDTPENAQNVAQKIKEENKVKTVLYGGSVTAQNVHSFTSMPALDGVLVGSASLDPIVFSNLIQNA